MASVRERQSKTGERTWAVLYRQGGKQTSKTFETPKAAEGFKVLIDQFGVDQALRLLSEQAETGGVTVRELAARWLEWKAGQITDRSAQDYRRDYENWIDPFFGHRLASYVTESDVQAWVDNNLRPRLGPKSVGDKHAILYGIFKWASARTRAIVAHNPCQETQLPKKKKTPIKGLTVAEWLALREAFYRVNEDAADLALFMASTGWRIGEATALMAREVEDDERMYVTISHVNRKGVGVVPGAKSDAGFRRIDVSADCARMLRRRLIGLGPNEFVFTNAASPTGLWEPSTFRRRYWSKAVELAGLSHRKPTPHWLRHTHVMLCHAAGMSLPEIQRRIGHEHISTTIDVYGRKLGEASVSVMGNLDALLTGGDRAIVAGEVVQGELA